MFIQQKNAEIFSKLKEQGEVNNIKRMKYNNQKVMTRSKDQQNIRYVTKGLKKDEPYQMKM